MQYTIRDIPKDLDRALRTQAKAQGKSLNRTIVDALKLGTGCSTASQVHTDLDWAIGRWVEDAGFDAAIRQQDTVNPEDWR